MKLKLKSLGILLLIVFSGLAQNPENEAKQKIKQLNQLINKAKKQGIDVTKERMSVRVAEIFLDYAKWDEKNKSKIAENFKRVESTVVPPNVKKRTSTEYANFLPNHERREVVKLLDNSIKKINNIISGKEKRKAGPQIKWDQIRIAGNGVKQGNQPLFLLDWNFKSNETDNYNLSDFFGDIDGYFFHIGMLTQNSNGKYDISAGQKRRLKNLKTGNFGAPFIGMTNVPEFARKKYPDLAKGTTTFTGFDIDHPQARELHKQLFKLYVPQFKNKNMSKLGYMLSNEPHWNISGTWDVIDITTHTRRKFEKWLQQRHKSINKLNEIWGTSFGNFRQAAGSVSTPVNESLIGTPKWYDFARFNQVRVIQWFTFLHDEIKRLDSKMKSHIKLIPGHWSSNSRKYGLDFEALTSLTEIIGNDGHMDHARNFGGRKPWQDKYALNWAEMSAQYDFMHSVSPDAINYNSEGHSVDTGKSKNLFLDKSYARIAQWLATIHGSDVTTNWAWLREKDGSIRGNNLLAGSVLMMPQVLNEFHSTMIDINTFAQEITALQNVKNPVRLFYSETSAINKNDHMTELLDIYESLYFEGHRLGFVTENIIKKQDAKNWEFIVVADTEYVTIAEFNALQQYLNKGGTILLDSKSLKKNEYGKKINKKLVAGAGNIISVNESNLKSQVLSQLKRKGKSLVVNLDETNPKKGFKAIQHRSTRVNGKNIITLANVGKEKSKAKLSLGKNSNVTITNLITGNKLSNNFEIASQQVLLLQVSGKTSSASNTKENNIVVNGAHHIKNNQTNQHIIAPVWDKHNARMFTIASANDQIWEFKHIGNKVHTIKNKGTGRFLEVSNAKCTNDANVNTWTSANANHHKWFVTKNGNDIFLRPTHCGSHALDKSNGNDGNVKLWKFDKNNANQKFELIAVKSNTSGVIKINGVYTIQNVESKQNVISPKWDNYNARMYRSLSAKDQQWQFEHIGNGVHKIKNVGTNRYLDVYRGQCDKGINIKTWTNADSNHQKWTIKKVNGKYFLHPLHCKELTLDKSIGNNGNVKLWEFDSNNKNQQFNLIAVKGAKELEVDFDIEVYPNPTTNVVNIANLDENKQIDTIVVYSLSGEVVQRITEKFESTVTIDLSDLANGLYIISCQTSSSGISNSKTTAAVFKVLKK